MRLRVACDLRRSNGSFVARRRGCADIVRGDGGDSARPTGQARMPGRLRQLSLHHEPEIRLSDFRFARGQYDDDGTIAARPETGRAGQVRRRADYRGQRARWASHAGQHRSNVVHALVRQPPDLACGGLARRRSCDVLRKVHHGPRPLRRDAQNAARVRHR